MDATFRPRHFPAELFAYAENKKIFEVFQNILEKLSIDRPEKPLEYLYDLLTKEAVYDVPYVFVLGPPSDDRTLLCTTLALKLGMMLITGESLLKNEDIDKIDAPNNWVALMKKRVDMPDCARKGWILEGFPSTRTEAFSLRKSGIFPTHIVLFEPYDLMDREETSHEVLNYFGQKSLILDLHRNSYVKKFMVESNINAVIDFVRSKKQPPLPYLPRVLFLGPYGSGRKTVAKKIAERYNLREVNYQHELRKAAMKESPTKKKISEILKMPSPIPDDLLVDIASERLLRKDCIESGWVMYNFPDTAKQAELLVRALEGFQVNRAVILHASLQTCLDRVEPLRFDPSTGNVYHLKINLKDCSQANLKSRLIQFPQDSFEFVEAEHRFFEQNVEELVSFFQQKLSDDITVEVDANGSADETFEAVQGAILKSTKRKVDLS